MGVDSWVGRTLSHYKVLEKLGQGGMGVVYRAMDTTLDRVVALKLLADDKNFDAERKKRFFQEARAASSLNHPNIITIYEIGTAVPEGHPVDYIAMEYVAGTTLHQCLGRKGLPLEEALRYAIQIADALATAHNAGIVHRDLKPGNIMVTGPESGRSGLVKVLDFGLAKLSEQAETDTMTATMDIMPRTVQGVIVGTVAYMSPEQAEGKRVDARSDIFSFGTVLYEMVTGRRPFQGETTLSTLSAILSKEPSPVSEVVEGLPRELERIILRCLRKEPERRVQHMDDLKVALEELRDESMSGRLIAGLPPSAVAGTKPRRRRLAAAIMAGVVIVAMAAGAIVWSLLGSRGGATNQPVLTRLTSDPGLTAYPAVSPDGKLLAYASDRSGEGNLDIWVQQIGGADPIRLTRHEADDYEPCFSADSTKIAFRSERDGGGIYVMPALGGESRLIALAGYRPRFSPDGTRVVYWAGGLGTGFVAGSARIFVAPVEGGSPTQVHPEFAAIRHPIWMSDGKHLLFMGRLDPKRPRDETMDWWIAPVDGGTPVQTGAFVAFRAQKLLPPPAEYAITPEVFLAESNSVVFSAALGDTTNVWEIPLSLKTGRVTGNPQRLTSGTGLELQASVAVGLNGRPLVVFSSLTRNVDVWAQPAEGNQGKIAGEIQRITRNVSFEAYPSVSRDGKKMVFVSTRSGNRAVWIRDLETGAEASLTAPRAGELQPKISGDGSKVVYWERDAGRHVTFVVPSRGGVPEKICEDCGPSTDVSADGNKALLESEKVADSLILLDLASRKTVELFRSGDNPRLYVYAGRFSPDERWIAFHAAANPTTRQIFIAPFREGAVVERKDWIPVTDGSALDRESYWSPNGSLLYFLSDRDGFRCIWAQRLDPPTKQSVGTPFPVQHFHHAFRSLAGIGGSPAAASLCVLRNQMIFALAELSGNIWMTQSP